MGCCDAGLVAGAARGGVTVEAEDAAGTAGVFGWTGGCTVAAGGCCAGGVTITAGGGASTGGVTTFSAGGATVAAGLAAGGDTTTAFSGCAGAAGAGCLGTTTAGLSCTAGGATATGTWGLGGATAGGEAGVAVATGRGGAGGCCCCISFSLSSLSTSPGLEILERSSFGLISLGVVFSREATELDLFVKCLFIFSASSASTELEWVFFSVMPTSSKTSRMALLFTSSSLARSLIRIFIRSVFPPSTRYAIIMTSRFSMLSCSYKSSPVCFTRFGYLRLHGFFRRRHLIISARVDFAAIGWRRILHTCQNFCFISLAGLLRLSVF